MSSFNFYSKGFEDYIKLKKKKAILGSGLNKPYNGLQQIENKSFSRDVISLIMYQQGLTVTDKEVVELQINREINSLLNELILHPPPSSFFTNLENILQNTNVSQNIDLSINIHLAHYYSEPPFFFGGPIIAFSSKIVTSSQILSLSNGSGILFPKSYSLNIGDSSYTVNSSNNLIKTTGTSVISYSSGNTVLLTGIMSPSPSITYLGASSPGLAVMLSSTLTIKYWPDTSILSWVPIDNVDKYTIKFYDTNQPAFPDFPETTTIVSIKNYFQGYNITKPMKFYVSATLKNSNTPIISSNTADVVLAPPLSNVVISAVTSTSFTISWDRYSYLGSSSSYTLISANDIFLGYIGPDNTSLSKTIYNLTPNTDYEVSIFTVTKSKFASEWVTQTIHTLNGTQTQRPSSIVLTYTASNNRLSWTDFGSGSFYTVYKNERILDQYAFPQTYIQGNFTECDIYCVSVTFDINTTLNSNNVTINRSRPSSIVLTYTASNNRLSWTDFGCGSSYNVYKNGRILDAYGFPQTYIQGNFTECDIYYVTVTYNDTTTLTSNTVTINRSRPSSIVLTYTASNNRLTWSNFGCGSSYTVYKNGRILDQYYFPETYIQGIFSSGDIYYVTVTYDTTTLTSNTVTIS